jgi:effector-binding domain-containing protein
VKDSADVAIKPTAESSALRFVHHGPYRDVRNTYDRIEAWLRERGGIKTPADWARYSPMWEEYLNDPATTPESELITRIYLTLR